MNDGAPERDLSRLAVPRWGRLVETGDRYEPYRLVDADGAAVVPAAMFFQELLAAGKTAATVRSYGMHLLRWWRFLLCTWQDAVPDSAKPVARELEVP